MIGTANRKDEALDAVNGINRYALPRWAQNVLGFILGSLLVALVTLGIRDHERIAVLAGVVDLMREEHREIKARQAAIDETYRGLLREVLELKAEFRAHRRREEE